jgi:predicted transglutaminase-like cysteine proteinase
MIYFSFLLDNKTLLATAGVSLAALLIALAIKAYDLFE